jgi:glucokinase
MFAVGSVASFSKPAAAEPHTFQKLNNNRARQEVDTMRDSYSIGVDLGGTNLRVAAYSGGQSFLESIALPTHLSAGRDQVVREMCEAIQALEARSYGDRVLLGIAVGSPGPLELPAGILRKPPNLPGWDGFNLKRAITSALGRDIVLDNDANLAALAEQKLGAGKKYGVDDVCVLTLGTGVGNGLILNGAIWAGSNGMAGEAGHIIVKDEDGFPCGCGGRGCLEQYASATAVMRMARERLGDAAPSSANEVAQLAQAGNEQARIVFETVGRALAVALTGLINTLNLPLYLLGGGVCEAWDLFAPAMFRELESRSYVYRLTTPQYPQPEFLDAGKTYILKAQLGSTAGLLGACILGLSTPTSRPSPVEDFLVHQ